MLKYTIKNIFQRSFSSVIWKIEVDPIKSLIAVETRDQNSTIPSIYTIDFQGSILHKAYTPETKEWTIETLQDGYLILKRVGSNTPTQEGIQIIEINTGKLIFSSYEFTLLDVYNGVIHVKHRTVSSQEKVLLKIDSGQLISVSEYDFQFACNKVIYPVTYSKRPHFLREEFIEGPLWLSKCGENYIWCYHKQNDQNFNLILALSDLNQLLDKHVVLKDMGRMIPQPYFQIGKQLFFMSYNKREIISYLV